MCFFHLIWFLVENKGTFSHKEKYLNYVHQNLPTPNRFCCAPHLSSIFGNIPFYFELFAPSLSLKDVAFNMIKIRWSIDICLMHQFLRNSSFMWFDTFRLFFYLIMYLHYRYKWSKWFQLNKFMFGLIFLGAIISTKDKVNRK